MRDNDEVLSYVEPGIQKGSIVKLGRFNDLYVHRVIDWDYNIDANKFVVVTVCSEFFFEAARYPRIDETRCEACFRDIAYTVLTSFDGKIVKELNDG